MAATQAEMFPDEVPEFVRNYWRAAKRWYSKTRRVPTREEFILEYRPRIPLRSFDRQKAKPVNKKWLATWPPKYGERPPWEIDQELPPIEPGDEDLEAERWRLFKVVNGISVATPMPAGWLAAEPALGPTAGPGTVGARGPVEQQAPAHINHPGKKVRVLIQEDDGVIRPLPAVLDLIDGNLHLGSEN